MNKLATSSPVPSNGTGGSNNKTTTMVRSESTNAWSRTASSNIRNATNTKVTTAGITAPPPGLQSKNERINASTETEATLISLRDRFLHLTLNLIGQNVQVTLTDGSIVEGILHTFTPFSSSTHSDPGFNSQLNKYVLKFVRLVRASNNPPDIQQNHILILPIDKVAHIFAKGVRLTQNPDTAVSTVTSATVASSFRTDTDISFVRKENGRDSEDFVLAGSTWTTAPTATVSPSLAELDVSLPDTKRTSNSTDAHSGRKGLFGTAYLPNNNNNNSHNNNNGNNHRQPLQNPGGTDPLNGSIGAWDQFSANEKLYGVKASFDENLYTTVLNVDSIDKTKREHAERLAREIESQVTSNIHIAEERGQSLETDFDEEDLYSGVLKKQNPIQSAEGTKKERTKITLLARTKEQSGTTTSADGDMNNIIHPNTNANANEGNETSLLNAGATTTKVASTESMIRTPAIQHRSTMETPVTSTSTSIPDTIVVSSNKKDNNSTKNTTSSTTTNIAQSQQKAPMNYAAAAAKGDAKFKSTQSSATTTATSMAQKKNITESTSVAPTSSGEVPVDMESTIQVTSKLHLDGTNSVEKMNSTSDDAFSSKITVNSLNEKDVSNSSMNLSSKLNANAKEFTFNPDAKSFTPTFSSNAASPMSAAIQQIEPDPQQFMGVGPYNPYMQHPAMPMMYPYPTGGMRFYPQGGTATNTPYVMMPTNSYMAHTPTQPMSTMTPPRSAHESPVAIDGSHDGVDKNKDIDTRVTGDVHPSMEGQAEVMSEGTEEAAQQNWEQQQIVNSMGGGYTPTPGTSVNSPVYYPGGAMSLHPSQPYGHMMPPQMNPMVQGHGGYNIVYNLPSHMHQGPGMGYGQIRGHPVAYSSGPYMPYGMVAPSSGTGPVEGGAGRGRGMGGMNHSNAGGRAPRRASGGRGSNAGGRSGSVGGGTNQMHQGALRNALGNSTRYFPTGMVESDNNQYDTSMNIGETSSNIPYSESIAEPSTDE